MPQHVIGVDIGKSSDYTAINVMELIPKGDSYEYHIIYLERPPIGTPYPEILKRIQLIANHPDLQIDSSIVVDATGVGAPVVDMLRESNPLLVAITITGGSTVNKIDNYNYTVPKRDLISNLQVLYQNKQIKISNEISEAEILVKELLNFKVKISTAGHDSYEAWREGIHDDLVLSVALAAWYHERNKFPFSLPDAEAYRPIENIDLYSQF